MRALKVLVIAMGIAILIATTVLVTVIIQRGARLTSEPSPAAGPAASAAKTLALPRGAKVLETRLADGRVVLRAGLRDGTEAVFVFAADSGRLVARYDLAPDTASGDVP